MTENDQWGKIISKETANQDFGPAVFSISVTSEQMKSFASKTSFLLMFKIIDNRLFILGDDRKPIYPEGEVPPQETVFKVFSKDKIRELLDTGGDTNNFVELRADTLTITNSDKTLEFGSMCPPWCTA